MQTFLPYENFADCAECLDYRRLGKQRVEAWQILQACEGLTKAWSTVPITLAWKGYEAALARYGKAMCDEWMKRGFRDNMRIRFAGYVGTPTMPRVLEDPPWVSCEAIHRQYKEVLITKNREVYGEIWPELKTASRERIDYNLLQQ